MSEGIKIQTTPQLVKHILDHWKSEQTKALEEERSQKEKLTVEIQKEQKLEKKLKESRSIAEKLEEEYSRIEARIEAEKRAQIEVKSIREKDVLDGKVTLIEFTKKGTSERQIYEEAVKQTMVELEQGLKAARTKRLEILELERELLETQTKIRYLIIEPGRTLQRALKDLAQFAEREIGLFLEEVHSSKTALEQVKGKLLLTEGKSLTPGYTWSQLTLEQARKIQFDPILPSELIPKLKADLEKLKNEETVTINFYIRSRTVEVNSYRVM